MATGGCLCMSTGGWASCPVHGPARVYIDPPMLIGPPQPFVGWRCPSCYRCWSPYFNGPCVCVQPTEAAHV